jgi:hypothetical protein
MNCIYDLYAAPDYDNLPDYTVVIGTFNSLPDPSPLCKFCSDLYGLRYTSEHDNTEEEKALRSSLLYPCILGVMLKGYRILRKDGQQPGLSPEALRLL